MGLVNSLGFGVLGTVCVDGGLRVEGEGVYWWQFLGGIW